MGYATTHDETVYILMRGGGWREVAVIEYLYERDERWVLHETGAEYAVSHEETGHVAGPRPGFTYADEPDEAYHIFMAWVERVDQADLEAAIERARQRAPGRPNAGRCPRCHQPLDAEPAR